MVVDNKLFTPGLTKLPNDLFWVLEQIPGFIHKEDLTHVLAERTFWPSYNSPYFEGYQIQNILNQILTSQTFAT